MSATLTSLPTRDAFCRRVDLALQRPCSPRHSVAVFYLDLDHFKDINSLHGRTVGDQVLLRVAQRFTRAAAGAAMAGRVGGDEFACLLLDHLDRAPLKNLAVQILAAVAKPARVGALDLIVAPSIGIVVHPEAGTDATTIMRCAAAAMYRARHESLGYAFDIRQRPAVGPMIEFGAGMLRRQ